MRKLLFISFFILTLYICSTAHAEWYVFNSNNRCVGMTKYKPDTADLSTRGEFAFKVDNPTIPMKQAEYFNGDVRVRVKSQDELNEEAAEVQEGLDMAKVYHRMFIDLWAREYIDGRQFSNKINKHIPNIQQKKNRLDNIIALRASAKTKLIAAGLTANEVDALFYP